MLENLLEAQSRRDAVAVVTRLASGDQHIVRLADLEQSPYAEILRDGFRFDRSGVHQTDDGEIFVNIHNPQLQLIIIGAVHIAQSLAPMAVAAGYRVTVIDPRGAFATKERFPGMHVRAEWPDEVLPDMVLDGRTAFAALTHDPKVDDRALEMALRAGCFYVGALGSKKTQAARRERLIAAGMGAAAIDRIHGPIGLDIGARGAPEIAISIMAEMTAALRQGSK